LCQKGKISLVLGHTSNQLQRLATTFGTYWNINKMTRRRAGCDTLCSLSPEIFNFHRFDFWGSLLTTVQGNFDMQNQANCERLTNWLRYTLLYL